LLSYNTVLIAQSKDTTLPGELEEVIIRAYEQGKNLHRLPAAVGYVGNAELKRFNTASILMAVNTTPGVRMEERSPGSYRINIRGSALRAPFGVRNVKVYFNELPYTDPGGHTYLNQLGFYDFGSLEIIKGPGSSLYGSGTGGVLLIESMTANALPSVQVEYTGGSFGYNHLFGAVNLGDEHHTSRFALHHLQTEGYRDHASVERTVFNWNGKFNLGSKTQLKTSFLLGDLQYQTPGALKLDEFKINPRSSRPRVGTVAGSAEKQAAIMQKTFLAGASLLHVMDSNFQNRISIYGMFTELNNPSIRNYGKNKDPHTGIRNTLHYQRTFNRMHLDLDVGAEVQIGFPTVDIHVNNNGNAETLQSHDELDTRQHFFFGQSTLAYSGWSLTAGLSINNYKLSLQRFSPSAGPMLRKEFKNVLAPRIVLSKQLNQFLVYGGAARGFSPPATSELAPSGSAINTSLEPEYGMNYDAGIKTKKANGLLIDINAFHFILENTLVQRRDAAGGEFFINSGSAKQSGIETSISFPFKQQKLQRYMAWVSHTWHHFRYVDFKQVNNDFSGKQMPGNPKHTIASGIEMQRAAFSANINYFFAGKLPLNDANSAYADAYHLLGFKMGWEKMVNRSFIIKISTGAENILNQVYSLGNDINGFGGRYYNAAPGRNFFASVALQWFYK
jgi:iron complex outermembrane receptor protein